MLLFHSHSLLYIACLGSQDPVYTISHPFFFFFRKFPLALVPLLRDLPCPAFPLTALIYRFSPLPSLLSLPLRWSVFFSPRAPLAAPSQHSSHPRNPTIFHVSLRLRVAPSFRGILRCRSSCLSLTLSHGELVRSTRTSCIRLVDRATLFNSLNDVKVPTILYTHLLFSLAKSLKYS